MPDACFNCHQRGHVARTCPKRRQKKPTQDKKIEASEDEPKSSPKTEERKKAEGEPSKNPGKKDSHMTGSTLPLSNPYMVLEEADEEETAQGVVNQENTEHEADQQTSSILKDKATAQQVDMEVEKEIKRKREREGAEAALFLSSQQQETGGQVGTDGNTSEGRDPAQRQPGSQLKLDRKAIRAASQKSQKEGRRQAGAKQKLRIDKAQIILEGGSDALFYLDILEEQGYTSKDEGINIRRVLKKAAIMSVGNWADWTWSQNSARPLQHAETCKAIFTVHDMSREYLNRKWGLQDNDRQWAKRFTGFWKSLLPAKEKVWVWKILNQGLPTLERACKWGHGDGTCARCGTAQETIRHLLWECGKAREKWRDVNYLGGDLFQRTFSSQSWIAALDKTLRHSPASLLILIAVSKAVWLERNHKTYAQQDKNIPLAVSFELAVDMAKSRPKATRDEDRRRKQAQETQNLLITLLRRSGPAVTETEDAQPANGQSQGPDPDTPSTWQASTGAHG
ncbi:hypothetical protein R1sor_027510 [Riccia sorocarpa]|uniref:CCHC-type domain-containing protein n=1 Tax=Riccia sorocarpa TaxID=122646 RepID=A0ABD3GG61_9MARC